jgi:hypothetical protein
MSGGTVEQQIGEQSEQAHDGNGGAHDGLRERQETVDASPALRPGVPMEAEPELAEGAAVVIREQPGAASHLHRAALDRATPVFGTAQPLRGLSGMLRRRAYAIPEHRARHWMLLMGADRVDVLEDRLGSALSRPLRGAGFAAAAERASNNPLPVLAGMIVGIWMIRRIAR